MSGDSFAFNFNINDFSDDSQDFPKSNVVELEGSKWYLGIEKAQSADDNCKHLNIFFACIRGNANGIYAANLALILRSSLIDLLFTKTHYFEPLDLEMSCFKIDCGYIFDKDNGFINEDGGCEIKAEISVTYFVTQEEVEEIDPNYKGSRLPSNDHVGIINLQEGYRVHVNKKILSSCSEYFNNLFNNPHFDESSQESIDLTHFTYKQFRLLYKHMFQRRYRYLLEDGTMEFRLKSKEGVTEFKKLCNLTNLRDNYKARGYHRRMWHPDSETQESKRLLKEVVDMFDDVKQMGALLGSACCVSIPNVPGEKQSISAENVADLLCVGSYFQVTEILNGCKEFLGTNYDFADFIIERRVELAEKYSLNSITERSMDGDSRSSSHSNTEIRVQVRFLDTWDNETCRVRYENFMTVQDLLIAALTNLYSDGICDCPSEYTPDKVRISELYKVSPVQIFHAENSGFKLLSVYISNTYSFEVRRKVEEAWRRQTRTEQDIHLTSKARSKVLAQLTLPSNEEKICEIHYKAGMSVKELYFKACRTLEYFPTPYGIESVHVCDSDSTSEMEPKWSLDIQHLNDHKVNSSFNYIFRMKQNVGEASTSKES